MKIECLCGTLITDSSDAMPDKARFVADQDWAGFSSGDPGAHDLVRWMYQCPSCGRLHVYDRHNQLHSFNPDKPGVSGLLGSTLGERYRVALSGSWEAWKDPPEGVLFWESAGSKPGGFEVIKDRARFESRYRQVFEQLKGEGRLRSAWLHDGETSLHSWPETRA